MAKGKDLTGQRFGRLVVLCDDGTRDKHRNIMWKCQCDCGEITYARTNCLTHKKHPLLSCGCLRDEVVRERMTGVPRTEEQKRKLSEERKGEGNPMYGRIGSNNPLYKSDLTDKERKLNKSRSGLDYEWRKCAERTKKRDNWTCDCCGKRGGDMCSHHKNGWDNFKEQRYDDDNVVTLCQSCHDEFHHIYKKGNNTEAQYIEFKENKQIEFNTEEEHKDSDNDQVA